MTNQPTSMRKSSSSSSSSLEDIPIRNIQTGVSLSSSELLSHSHHLARPPPQQWQHYFKDIHSIGDILLGRVIRREAAQLEQYLVEYPVDLGQMRYMDGWGLLHFAVSQDDTHIAHLLLKFGLPIDLTTKELKRTPLHQATLANRLEMVRLLLQWGANPNALDADYNSSLHLAVDHSYPEIVKALMTSPTRLDLAQRNCMNMTPFNICRNPQIFQMLEHYASKYSKVEGEGEADESTFATVPRARLNRRKGPHCESRLVKSDSHYIPHSTRSDQVEKFLSLRQAPEKKPSLNNSTQYQSISIISENSVEDNSSASSPNSGRKRSHLMSRALLRSRNKVRQNLGLAKQSMLMTHLQNEEQVSNYDILRQIGEGSFGQVFLVRRKRSSNLYAMKRIEKRCILQHNLQAYLYAQKKVYTEVQHPFIIRAEHCLQDLRHLYILLEYCPHGDLSQHIRSNPLPQPIVKTYFCEAALAIQALHERGMLYRDLKVSNVLVDRQGHIKLSDFGLVKEGVVAESFVGSVGYVAPELLVEGTAKTHGPQLDWYLLGLFLYELLHGQPPFYTENHLQMEHLIRNSPPVISPSISPPCAEAILALLHKDPSLRPCSLPLIKQLSWLEGVDWEEVLQRRGVVLQVKDVEERELRRKQYQEGEEVSVIDQKVEWFEGWNYPPKLHQPS